MTSWQDFLFTTTAQVTAISIACAAIAQSLGVVVVPPAVTPLEFSR